MEKNELQIIIEPSQSDLSKIEEWLKIEFEEEDEGFYHNWLSIKESPSKNEIIVLSKNNYPIGFVTYYGHEKHIKIGIFAIEPKYRRKGYGKVFYEKIAEHFKKENYVAIKLFCRPSTSESFWKKVGFIKYPDLKDGVEPLTYYKPIIKTQPLSNANSDRKLELWNLEPSQLNNNPPKWTWDLNTDYEEVILPIIHPCRKHWNLRWTENGKTIFNDQVKYFEHAGKSIYFHPFLYIPSPTRVNND